MKTCSFEGCSRKHDARGWCTTHYMRWKKHGSPHVAKGPYKPRAKLPLDKRFWSKVDKSGNCWQWTASKFHDGYGKFNIDGKVTRAHRVAYELCVERIPDGILIDHICHVPACVNPSHLRLATHKQNSENILPVRADSGFRGVSWSKSSKKWAVYVKHKGADSSYHGVYADIQEANRVAIAVRERLFTHTIERKPS